MTNNTSGQKAQTDQSTFSGEPLRVEPIKSAPEQNLYRTGSHTLGQDLYRTGSHVSGQDNLEPPLEQPLQAQQSYREFGDEVYDRLSKNRKLGVVAVLSFCAFLSPVSSTTVLAATPEVAATYGTTGSIINLSNSGYMVLMAVSPIVWGPMSQVFGRRPITLITAAAFLALSIGTALAPNLVAFFVFRAISAFVGTGFILIGAACIGDMYRPTERGTAMGWFMSGTLIGPALGPFIGGIIVTYSSWRTIFWLQTALAGTGLLGVFFLVPETIHYKQIDDFEGQPRNERIKHILGRINPIRVLRWFRYLNVGLVAGASASLVWNMYSLLTPIRYVLNPRFHLDSPLLSGLFYLAPGCGYLLGTFGGGRWADWTVKRWIEKRGRRIPEDRLRAVIPFVGFLMPGCMLVYGWTVDQEKGGIPVPVIAMFIQGVGQLFCFPALNTYCLDAVPGRGAEVAAANFFVRYLAGCVGTAVVLPIVNAVGIGWFSTISAGLMVLSATGSWWAIIRGDGWMAERKGEKAIQDSHDSPQRDEEANQSPEEKEAPEHR